MAKGVARARGRAYLLLKAMKTLTKRGKLKPPLTALNERQRQVLSLLVHGLNHADADRPDVPLGRPLSAPEIAETLSCRRSYVRDLLSDPLFKTEMAKAVADARAALQPKALATLSENLDWVGDGRSADANVRTNAARTIMGDDAKAFSVNVQVNNQVNSGIRPGYVLDLGAMYGRRHDDEPTTIEREQEG
jgi:hypothetical protein